MKKAILWILAIFCTVTLAACATTKYEPYYFFGEVTEVYKSEKSCLVKVTDYGNCGFSSEEMILQKSKRFRVGESLKIGFDGLFLESDPPIIKNPAIEIAAPPEQQEEPSFEATVLEVHDTYLLVEPAEGCWERTSADKIEVSLIDKTSWPIPQAGDRVNVFYDGQLMETYPARVSKLYRVEIIN